MSGRDKAKEKTAQELKELRKRVSGLEAELKIFHEAISDYITVIGPDYRILNFNKTVEDQFGTDLKGQLCYETYQGRDGICPDCAAQRSFRSGKTEFTFQPATEVGRPCEIYAYPVFDDKGEVTAVVEHGRDVSDKLRMIETLREALESSEHEKAKSEAVIAAMGVGVNILDKDFKVLYQNDIHKALVGGDFAGQHCYRAFEGRDDICEGCAVAKAFKDGGIHTVEWKQAEEKGSKHVEITASPIKDSSGNIISAVELVCDISRRKKMEDVLKQSEERLRQAQRIAGLGFWDWDIVSDDLYWSDETYRIFGFRPQEFAPTFERFSKLVHPDDLDFVQSSVKAALDADEGYDIVFRFVLPSGEVRFLHTQGDVTRGPDGRAVRFIGTEIDITERKLAVDALSQKEAFIRNIIDNVDEGFLVVDRDYKIITANRAYCTSFNRPSEDVIGKHCYEISHNSTRPCYENGEDCAVRGAFETGESITTVHTHVDGHGNTVYVETKAFPLRDQSGDISSVIETINNITEKHLLEEEQLKTQKLEAIGTLAGGIAHDFNNLLQGVFGYISMTKLLLKGDTKGFQMLSQAERALGMSVSLTQQLLTFSKGGAPLKKPISIAPIIEDSFRFALSGTNIDRRFDIDDGLWGVEADGGQISQVVQNITLNASEAMPGGGTITVAATNLKVPPNQENIHLKEGHYVKLSITDTGTGIPENIISKIFDPYFTTKQKGSGLGLATSYSIIRNHGGVIDVSSRLGKGSTFHIYLPATASGPEPEAIYAPSYKAGSGRMLIMDDEELVRDILAKMVRSLGHEVQIAKTGEEAVEMYAKARDEGKPFDIAMLDLTVRGAMGGGETVIKLAEIDPDVTALVLSGFSDNEIMSNYEDYGFKACLAKPFTLEDLNAKIIPLLEKKR